jgi:AraC-like DNA-binding protein
VNRITQLVQTPAVSVERFDHVPGVAHRDPEREQATRHAISFVESGGFALRVAGRWHHLEPGHLFVTTPGLEFACAHDAERPDDVCLSVRFAEAAVESLRSAGAGGLGAPVASADNRRRYLGLQLAAGDGDGARTEALAGALYWSLSTPGPVRRPFGAGQLGWYAARLARARELMDTAWAAPLTLSQIAREAGMSPYHFARVFAELEGVPPHRYLVAVRLRHAAARLQAGGGVTDTAHATGFGSPSHFATAFRRRFGVTPSRYGRATSCRARRPTRRRP